jgi:hypothetical protein
MMGGRISMANEPIMNNSQRALQLWSLLVLAAKTQTVLDYGTVARMTGLANEHPHPLGHIAFYCMKNRMPLLSVLEVSQKTGNPSADFYDGMDIAAEQRRCFVHDWLADSAPTVEQLEGAYTNREEIQRRYIAERIKAAAANV